MLVADLPKPYRYAHPICVIKKLKERGYKPKSAPYDVRLEAAKECFEEGKTDYARV